MSAPVFNLKASNLGFKSDEDLKQKLDEQRTPGFEQGNYDFEIKASDWHKNKDTGLVTCDGDDSWYNVVATCGGADERTTKYYVQVPTTTIYYKGKKGPTLFVFKKFCEFMAGIGEHVTLENLESVVTKYFTDPKKLVGKKFNGDVGYDGPYIEKVSETECRIIRNGKPVEEAGEVVTFPDFQSARAYADGARIKTSRPGIIKITPAKGVAAANDSEW